jgi:hypothetical protein
MTKIIVNLEAEARQGRQPAHAFGTLDERELRREGHPVGNFHHLLRNPRQSLDGHHVPLPDTSLPYQDRARPT